MDHQQTSPQCKTIYVHGGEGATAVGRLFENFGKAPADATPTAAWKDTCSRANNSSSEAFTRDAANSLRCDITSVGVATQQPTASVDATGAASDVEVVPEETSAFSAKLQAFPRDASTQFGAVVGMSLSVLTFVAPSENFEGSNTALTAVVTENGASCCSSWGAAVAATLQPAVTREVPLAAPYPYQLTRGQSLGASEREDTGKRQQAASIVSAVACTHVNGAQCKTCQKVPLRSGDCGIRGASYNEDSASSSLLPSGSDLSPLNVSSMSPTSPTYQHRPSPSSLPPLSDRESGLVKGVNDKQDVADMHKSFQPHQYSILPVLMQPQKHSTPLPALQEQQHGVVLVPSQLSQQQVHYALFPGSDWYTSDGQVPLDQVEKSHSLQQMEQQQTDMRLSPSTVKEGNRHEVTQQQQQHRDATASPVINFLQQQPHEKEALAHPPQDTESRVRQPGIPGVEKKYAATRLQQHKTPLVLPAVHDELVALHSLLLLIAPAFHSGEGGITTLHKNAKNKPRRRDSTTLGIAHCGPAKLQEQSTGEPGRDAASKQSNFRSVSAVEGNHNNSSGCFITGHARSTWVVPSDDGAASYDALGKLLTLLAELTCSVANRRPDAVVPAAAAHRATGVASHNVGTSSPPTRVKRSHLLVPLMKHEAGQQQISLEECTHAVSSLRTPFSLVGQRIDASTMSCGEVVKAGVNATWQSEATRRSSCALGSGNIDKDYQTKGRLSGSAAEVLERESQKPADCTHTTSLFGAKTGLCTAPVAGTIEGSAARTVAGVSEKALRTTEDNAGRAVRHQHTTAVGHVEYATDVSHELASFHWVLQAPASGVDKHSAEVEEVVCPAARVVAGIPHVATAGFAKAGGATSTADLEEEARDRSAKAQRVVPYAICGAAVNPLVTSPVSRKEAVSLLLRTVTAAVSPTCDCVRECLDLAQNMSESSSVLKAAAAASPDIDAPHTGSPASLFANGADVIALAPRSAVGSAGDVGVTSDDVHAPSVGDVSVLIATKVEEGNGPSEKHEANSSESSSFATKSTSTTTLSDTSNSVTCSEGSAVTMPTSPYTGAGRPCDVTEVTFEPYFNESRAIACPLSYTLRNKEARRAFAFEHDCYTNRVVAGAVANADGAAEAAKQEQYQRSLRSCKSLFECRRKTALRPKSDSNFCSRNDCPRHSLNMKDVCASMEWPCDRDRRSSSNSGIERESFNRASGSKDSTTEKSAAERFLQNVHPKSATRTADAAFMRDRAAAAATTSASTGFSFFKCEGQLTPPDKAALGIVRLTKKLSSKAASIENEEQKKGGLLQRRERLSSRLRLLPRGCWVLQVLSANLEKAMANSGDTGVDKITCGTKHSRVEGVSCEPSSSNERGSTSSVIEVACGRRRDTYRAKARALTVRNVQCPAEPLQLLRRRYLYVAPDFQYICCSDIPPPRAAVSGQMMAYSPFSPLGRRTNEHQQQHMRVHQSEGGQTSQHSRHTRLQPQLQPEEQHCRNDPPQADCTFAQEQQSDKQPTEGHQRAPEQEGQHCGGREESQQAPEPLQNITLHAQKNSLELPEQMHQWPLRQGCSTAELLSPPSKQDGRLQSTPAKIDTQQQQTEIKAQWLKLSRTTPTGECVSESCETDTDEVLLFTSSACFSEEEMEASSGSEEMKTDAPLICQADGTEPTKQQPKRLPNVEPSSWHTTEEEISRDTVSIPTELSNGTGNDEIDRRPSKCICHTGAEDSNDGCFDQHGCKKGSSTPGSQSTVASGDGQSIGSCSTETEESISGESNCKCAITGSPFQGRNCSTSPCYDTLMRSGANYRCTGGATGQNHHRRLCKIKRYLKAWSKIQRSIMRGFCTRSGKRERNFNNAPNNRNGRRSTSSIGSPFQVKSSTLGYGSLITTLNGDECLGKHAGRVPAPAPILAPASCVWLCADDIPSSFTGSKRIRDSSFSLSRFSNSRTRDNNSSCISRKGSPENKEISRPPQLQRMPCANIR